MDRYGLYAAMLLGAFLRLYRLGHQSIWGDEALTLQLYTAGSSLSEVLSNIWEKAFHPPLYFLVAHYWYRLGDSEFMLRFPSAVFGIALIPVVYILTRKLFNPRISTITAFLVAVSPFNVWYSQEARMYSLQMLLVAGSILLFIKAWQTRRPIDFAAYALVTAAALFTHMSTVALVAAQGVFALAFTIKDRRALVLIGMQGLALAVFTPWLLNFFAERSVTNTGQVGFGQESNFLHLGYGLFTFNVGYSLGPTVAELHYLSASDAVRSHLPVIIFCAVVFGVLTILGLFNAYRAHRFAFWLLLSMFSIPICLVAVGSLMPGVGLTPRYLIPAVVPYWIVMGIGLEAAGRSRLAPILPAAVTLVIAVSLYNHFFQPACAKQDVRSAVNLINHKAQPDDAVIISSVELGGPFIYYFKRKDVQYFGYPPSLGMVNPKALAADMDEILANKEFVWLILGRTWSSDPDGLILQHFSDRHEAIEARHYAGVSVWRFRVRN